MSNITEAQVKDWLEAKRVELGLKTLELASVDFRKPFFSPTAKTGEMHHLVDNLSSIKRWALKNNEDVEIKAKIAEHEQKAAELKKSIGEAGDEG